jgi:Domain of unknown function (DUF4136)
MRKPGSILVTVAAALTVACSTMTTAVDYDRTIDWSKYKTFQIMEGTRSPVTFTQKRIEDGITQALTAKGMQPTTNNPSLLVYPHVVMSEQKQWNTMSMGSFGYRGWGGMGGGMATTTEQNIPIGTLIVDMVDPNSKEMVWRGTATDQVTATGEDQGTINQAMEKLFANFPPAPGSK